jgi:hypothetical protein
MPAVTARFVCICGALLIVASVAFAGGDYQRTRDGKTTVWNAYPRPGETATWFGDRDSDGYASGFGTLTWYTASGHIYGRYFGNMVRGKFDGPVNVHVKGQTAHAIFDNGNRTTRWAAGSAPSRIPTEHARPSGHEPAVVKAEGEAGLAAEETPSRPKPRPTPGVEHLAVKKPAATPTIAPVRSIAKTENTGHLADLSESSTHRTQKPPPPATAKPSPARVPSETPTPTPSAAKAAYGVAEGRQKITESPAEGPSPSKTPVTATTKRAFSKPAGSKHTKTKVDESLRMLVGPPSSLRKNVPTGGWSAGNEPESTPSAGANANLTKLQVLDLADAAARAHGYNPAEFRRPQAQYDPAKKTWSLFYDQKHEAGEIPEIGKYFTVTVDDATKKASIVPAR